MFRVLHSVYRVSGWWIS